jgi:ABC-type nitrate/sulfonate/bicarbonate transport system permease component
MLSGFSIAVVPTVPLGLAIGRYARLGEACNQLIEVLRNTAPPGRDKAAAHVPAYQTVPRR